MVSFHSQDSARVCVSELGYRIPFFNRLVHILFRENDSRFVMGGDFIAALLSLGLPAPHARTAALWAGLHREEPVPCLTAYARQIAWTGRTGGCHRTTSSIRSAVRISGIAHFRTDDYSTLRNHFGFIKKGNNAFIGKELRKISIYGLDKVLRFSLSFEALFLGIGSAKCIRR